ncbi:acyltransferase [Fundidesulfovibrio butyratiphilus]
MSRAGAPFRPAGDFLALAGRGFPALDGLRGLACVMIFNVHFFAQFSQDAYFLDSRGLAYQALRTLHSGSHGVDIFFVISGYLIYGSLARKGRGLVSFLTGRYKRLLPVALAVNVPALFWINAGWRDAIDNLFFLSLFPGTRMVTFVAWALVYEMYFYILCGVWLLVVRRGRAGAPWVSFGGLLVLYLANCLFFRQGQVLSDWRFVGFFVGLGLAMLQEGPRGRAALARVPRQAWPLFLGLLLLCSWLWAVDAVGWLSARSRALALGYFVFHDLAVAGLIAALANGGPNMRSPFTWFGLRAVGAVSYSFFMLHTQWGLPLAASLLGAKPQTVAGLGLFWGWTFAVSFGLAVFLYAHLERFYFTGGR